jgi:type IV secretory pathway protease TraF
MDGESRLPPGAFQWASTGMVGAPDAKDEHILFCLPQMFLSDEARQRGYIPANF